MLTSKIFFGIIYRISLTRAVLQNICHLIAHWLGQPLSKLDGVGPHDNKPSTNYFQTKK